MAEPPHGLPKRHSRQACPFSSRAQSRGKHLYYFGYGTRTVMLGGLPGAARGHAAESSSGKNVPLLDANNGGSAAETRHNSLEKVVNGIKNATRGHHGPIRHELPAGR